MKSFDGGVAVVTGGAGAIGRAIGSSLARAGATVVLADIDTARTVAAASDIGGDASPETVDVTNSDQVHRLAERVLQRHGRLDVWCNNAGLGLAATAGTPSPRGLAPDDRREHLGDGARRRGRLPDLRAPAIGPPRQHRFARRRHPGPPARGAIP